MNFKKIEHDDMAKIWPYLQQEKGRTTDFSYGGILMWVDLFNYEYAIEEDTLFIKGVVEDDMSLPAFSLPIGPLSLKEAVAKLKEYSSAHMMPLEFSAVPEYALQDFEDLNPQKITLLEHWSDYLYDAEMLATLQGKKMSKKRNHVNQFDHTYPDWSFEPLTPENAESALKFMNVFDSQLEETQMAKVESSLSRKMIKMIAEGDAVMQGGLLYAKPGEICGLTIGDRKGDTLYIHIEKALRKVAGSYEKINKEFASHMLNLHPEIKYINREDDAGEEGLRLAKESYHPITLLKKYNVVF